MSFADAFTLVVQFIWLQLVIVFLSSHAYFICYDNDNWTVVLWVGVIKLYYVYVLHVRLPSTNHSNTVLQMVLDYFWHVTAQLIRSTATLIVLSQVSCGL